MRISSRFKAKNLVREEQVHGLQYEILFRYIQGYLQRLIIYETTEFILFLSLHFPLFIF